MSTDLHPFDRAVALSATGVPNQYQGTASPDYWNMVGPYGGITAAMRFARLLTEALTTRGEAL